LNDNTSEHQPTGEYTAGEIIQIKTQLTHDYNDINFIINQIE